MITPKEIPINKQIILKIIDESYAPDIAKLANNKVFHTNIKTPYPYTTQDGLSFITMSLENHRKCIGERNYGIIIDGEYAGNLGREVKQSGRKKHNYHLGYRLGEPYRGKGYMTTIVTTLTAWMFENIDDCHRIYALAFGRNTGSARVLEKSGFTLEGTLEKQSYESDNDTTNGSMGNGEENKF